MVSDDVPKLEVLTYADLSSTAAAIADRLVNQLIGCAADTHISVTGGGLGSAIWPEVVKHPGAAEARWDRLHIWFSDERFVPAGDTERNDIAVIAVAEELGLPLKNVHRVPGPDTMPTVEAAAFAYASELAKWKAPRATDLPAPVFAISILGIGPDGHVASLFPGRPEGAIDDAMVVAVKNSPKPPPERVSFTRPLLMQCQELWMIAAGAEKAQAVSRAIAGDDPTRTPAAGLHGRQYTLWFVDTTASATLHS